MHCKTLGHLAKHVRGRVIGDPGIIIKSAATLENARKGEISFLSNRKYKHQVADTKASAVIVSEEAQTKAALLLVEDPYYAFMQIVVLLHGYRKHKKLGISSRASVAGSSVLGENCNVYDFAVISDDVRVGCNCVIYSGVFIGPNTTIGEDCIIYPNAVIYDGCKVGNRVIIHSNASVGQDGFGFAAHQGIHHKIPQIGRVILEDDVEIGSGCAIERGTLDDTVIGQGSKIGDMVAIGHGTKIGPHCLLVPQVGVAGSAVLGHHCVLGGQVGVVGHIKIGNMVTIGAQAGVVNNIPDGAQIVGAPAIEAKLGKRAYTMIQYLPEMRKSIRKLEKSISAFKASDEQA
jgi:UDP-3-O-[3-hydroxymyristoyl] glucosamine N-acyltransferase